MNLSKPGHESEPFSWTDLLLFKRPNGEVVPLDFSKLRKAYNILQILNHPIRQRMLVVIEAQPGITNTALCKILSIEQSHASHHIAMLRKIRVISTLRAGKFTKYSIDAKRCMLLCNQVAVICQGR